LRKCCFAEKNGFPAIRRRRHKGQACSEKYTAIHANCRFFLPLTANSCQLPEASRRELPQRVPLRGLTRELVSHSGKPTEEFTPLRGPGPIAKCCGFPAISARIYAVGLECPGESAAPAGIGKSSMRPRMVSFLSPSRESSKQRC